MAETDQGLLLERYLRLIEISLDLVSTLDLSTLLTRIVHAAADLCQAKAASILLYDEVKQQLYFDAASNLDEPLMRGLVVPVEGSLAGWIVTQRQPIIITDAQRDPRHFGAIGKITNLTTHSLLGVPLIAQNKVIGALETINKQAGEFTQEDQDLLMALAAQAALAIENARLFQQSDLISELVHELRTPLTSINTAARMLLNTELGESARLNMAEVIFNETRRLSEMTNVFLDLARLESGRAQFVAQVFDVLALLEDCVRLEETRAAEKDIRIYLEVPVNLPPIKADRDKIKQVLLNLVTNAIKYNRPSGTITIQVEEIAQTLIIRIRDTGFGIPPKEIKHIFEKFYRVPGTEHIAPGTGLGLSICKKIIEAHHGHIDLESEVGTGTQFSIYLPIR